jgi:hypothetical protein
MPRNDARGPQIDSRLLSSRDPMQVRFYTFGEVLYVSDWDSLSFVYLNSVSPAICVFRTLTNTSQGMAPKKMSWGVFNIECGVTSKKC